MIFKAGSILFLMKRLSGKIQNATTIFNIDNSMMRQLFNVNKIDQAPDSDLKSPKNDIERLVKTLHKKEVYNADNKYDAFENFRSCCCCCRRNSRMDKLFTKAKDKLYSEIDILKIVKELRVAKFASKTILKPN